MYNLFKIAVERYKCKINKYYKYCYTIMSCINCKENIYNIYNDKYVTEYFSILKYLNKYDV